MGHRRMTEFIAITDEFRTMVIKCHFNLLPHIYTFIFKVVSFFQVSPPESCMHSLIPIHATYPVYLIFIQLVTIISFGMEYKPWISFLFKFLLSYFTSSLPATDIFLRTLFTHSLNMTNHVSHQYTATGKIILTYILIIMFLGIKLKDKKFWTKWQQKSPQFSLLWICFCMQFWFVCDKSKLHAKDSVPTFQFCSVPACGSHGLADGVAARLVGGDGATNGQWPSVALLYHTRYKSSCTTSIISPKWLLSSYSCLHLRYIIDIHCRIWCCHRAVANNSGLLECDAVSLG